MKSNDLYLNQGKRPDQTEGSEKAGCLAAIFFLVMILIGLITSCNPYPRLTKPARMSYSVDGILCRTYDVNKDTIRLYDAGYWAFKRVQWRATDITLIDNHVIVKMK